MTDLIENEVAPDDLAEGRRAITRDRSASTSSTLVSYPKTRKNAAGKVEHYRISYTVATGSPDWLARFEAAGKRA